MTDEQARELVEAVAEYVAPPTPVSTGCDFGLAVEANQFRQERDFIPRIESTVAGNIVLVVGRETAGRMSFEQQARVVMTPSEAVALGQMLVKEVTQ